MESNYFIEIPSTHWAKGSIEAIRRYINPYYDSILEAKNTSEYTYMNEITGDLEITREAFVYAVSTIYGYNEDEYTKGEEKDLFADYEDILFPKETVLAYKNGVISGEIVDGKVYIRPTRYITRAEASAIFNNLLKEKDRINNENQDSELIAATDSIMDKFKKYDFETMKNSIYDTAGVLKNRDLTVSEDDIKEFKGAAGKYFQKFKYEIIETGFNGFNSGYAKIKVKGYNVKQKVQDVFSEVYLNFEGETVGASLKKIFNNFSNGIKDKTIKIGDAEETFNFVKQDGEWKLWIQ